MSTFKLQTKAFKDNVSSIDILNRQGYSMVVGTPTVTIKEVDANGDVTYCVGTTIPTAGDAGYASGCFFKKSDGGTGTCFYVNQGTNASASFNPVLGGRTAVFGTAGVNVAHAIYDFAVDGGAVGAIVPARTVDLPANAIIVATTVNSTTAVTSTGSATVAIGLSAGGTASALLAATAKATLSANAVLNGVPVFATPVKTTASGNIQFTVAVQALTAGVIEVWVYYVLAAN